MPLLVSVHDVLRAGSSRLPLHYALACLNLANQWRGASSDSEQSQRYSGPRDVTAESG